MSLQGRMADSVEPKLIPRLYAAKPNGVAAYYDGNYAWDPTGPLDFPYYWMITVTGNPAHARHARVIDVERGDAIPEAVPAYRQAREAIGGETIVYCSRDTVPLVQRADPHWRSLHWWISTLDDRFWTPNELNAWLRAHGTQTLYSPDIKAIQWAGRGSYDESSLWQSPNFTHSTF